MLAATPRADSFGNGRFARNVLEAAIGRHAWRLRDVEAPTTDQLRQLLAEDLDDDPGETAARAGLRGDCVRRHRREPGHERGRPAAAPAGDPAAPAPAPRARGDRARGRRARRLDALSAAARRGPGRHARPDAGRRGARRRRDARLRPRRRAGVPLGVRRAGACPAPTPPRWCGCRRSSTDLVQADAAATNAFLVGGLEPAGQRAAYDEAVADGLGS